MKTRCITIGIAFLTLNSLISAQQVRECAPVLNTSLFNGRDLNSWTFFIKDQSVDPAGVFLVKDAAMRITGNPFGYMRTREQFADYKLHLEWRWPVEATNSGVFIHAQEPDAQWPQCIEVQLKAGDAGDFICVAGASMNERIDENNRIIRKMKESNEDYKRIQYRAKWIEHLQQNEMCNEYNHHQQNNILNWAETTKFTYDTLHKRINEYIQEKSNSCNTHKK
jgi:hypothetical protein